MSMSPDEYAARFQKLKENYAARLPERLEAIRAASAPLLEGRWSTPRAIDAAKLLHNLAGTAETFGYAQLGDAARELEDLVLRIHLGQTTPTVDEVLRLRRRAGALWEETARAGVAVSERTRTA